MSKFQSKTRKRQESSEKPTLLVRSGSAVVRFYTQQRNGKRQYTVAWYTGGKRHRQFYRTLEQAQKFAKLSKPKPIALPRERPRPCASRSRRGH